MTNKIKVALVGCGVIAPNHISSLLALDDVKIVALCDIEESKARDLMNRFSLTDVKIYNDYEKMLNSERELTSIHIATPHYLHVDMAIMALEKGINVFLEKPMCIHNEDIERLKLAQSLSSAKICISFQNRFTSAVTEAMRIINDDGGAKAGFATIVWQRDEGYYKSAARLC